jgi:large subunit ribosomal protein L4
MRKKALYTLLSQKVRDNEVLFLDSIALPEAKTKEAKAVFNKLGNVKGFEAMPTKRKNALMMALAKKDTAVEKSFRNFGNISLVEARNLNVADLINYKYVAIVDGESYVKSITK